MLQNARVTAFTASELLREKQPGRGGGRGVIYLPTQIMLFRRRRGLKMYVHVTSCIKEELIR